MARRSEIAQFNVSFMYHARKALLQRVTAHSVVRSIELDFDQCVVSMLAAEITLYLPKVFVISFRSMSLKK